MLVAKKGLIILTSSTKASISMGTTRIFQGDEVNTRILPNEQLENLLTLTFKLFKNIFMYCSVDAGLYFEA
jgi:hypothetical protein